MPVPGELPPNWGPAGPVPAAWGHEGSTFPGAKAGPEAIVGGEGEADGAPGFALCRLVLNSSEEAASAQESKKDEICCDCCLAKEVAAVTSCLACPEHRPDPPRTPSCRPAG